MAECRYCGAEVEVGGICAYCGRVAEPFYYPEHTTKIKKGMLKEKPPQMSIQVGTQYVVVCGDSLWNIAKRAYGKGSLYKYILEHNRQIKNPNLIYAGQRIYILPYKESRRK